MSNQYSSQGGREWSYAKGDKEGKIYRIRVSSSNSNFNRTGHSWYLRIQVKPYGRRMIQLSADRRSAWEMAQKIRKLVKAGTSLVEAVEKIAPQSSTLESLRAIGVESETDTSRTASVKKRKISTVTITDIVNAYQNGAEIPSNDLDRENARRCVNQLRKVIMLGLNLEPPKNSTKKEIKAAEKRAFDRPVSDLNAAIVDAFKDRMLGLDSDFEDIDEVERLKRSQSANSTFRQAKSIFAQRGQKIFRRANLIFDLPREFLDEGFLKVSHGKYSLPEFHRIEGIFKELLTLRESNPSHYLVRLIGLYVNLRPSEIVYLRKDQIQYSGYWKVDIRVRPDFKPKHYHERSIKISAGLAGEILSVCQNNGSVFVLSDTERLEIFREINPDLRNKFLPEAKRPSYELRKFYASASNFVLGIETTHERMGHNDPTTTKDHYIDKDTPQELVDLYDKYATKLFGDIAFPK